MAHEKPTVGENEKFHQVCEQFGADEHYEIFMKRNWTNWNSFRTVTVRNSRSGAYATYFADHSPDNPQYWLTQFSEALAEKRFGARSK